MKRHIRGGLLGLVLAVSAAAHAADPPTAPSPSLDPSATVNGMLAALKKNSDKGIAQLYSFSSPGNKEKIGPLKNFIAMMHEGFPDMLGHRSAKQSPALVEGQRAMIAVEMIGSDGHTHHYGFLLSHQEIPECRGCWMADAVVNLDNPDGGPGSPESPETPATTAT